MYLGRPERETKPWYADKELKRVEEKETGEEAEERRARERRKDIRSKERNDPLTTVNALLSTRPTQPVRRHPPSTTTPSDPASARIKREQSERERALALIAKSKAPARVWDTPSSVGGGRSWAEDLERQKDRAGRRFWGDSERVERSWDGRPRAGRSWEV